LGVLTLKHIYIVLHSSSAGPSTHDTICQIFEGLNIRHLLRSAQHRGQLYVQLRWKKTHLL